MNDSKWILLEGDNMIELPRREHFATEEITISVHREEWGYTLRLRKTVNRAAIEWEIRAEIPLRGER